MGLISMEEARAAVAASMPVRLSRHAENIRVKSAGAILESTGPATPLDSTFDTFLSHSYRDAGQILILKKFLALYRITAYVDWVEDKKLDRSQVTSATAELLRIRMRHCDSLIVVTSLNTPASKWVPWELGFADGIHGRVAILPIAPTRTNSFHYQGQEYFGIYPHIVRHTPKTGVDQLWVYQPPNKWVLIHQWLQGVRPYARK